MYNFEEEMEFTCDCCGEEYRGFEMQDVGEYYICDMCVEEVEMAM